MKTTLAAGKIALFIAAVYFVGLLLYGVGYAQRQRHRVAELPFPIETHESVFWEPLDTASLRKLIKESPLVHGKSVLEIGTGSGLLAICCKYYGAANVMATDVNPAAVECAKTNSACTGVSIDVRLVPPDAEAFHGLPDGQKFDLIVSNPPWEDGTPEQWSDFALYDPGFRLLRSILQQGRQHLSPNGKIVLAYGCVEAIHAVRQLADEWDYDVVVFDDRDLDSLPPVFLPGMLLGLTPKPQNVPSRGK